MACQASLHWCCCLSLVKLDSTIKPANAWFLDPSLIRRPLWLDLPLVPVDSSVQINHSNSHVNLYRDQYSATWPPKDQTDHPSIKSATLANVDYQSKGSNRYVPLISTRIVSKRDQVNPSEDNNRFMPETGHHFDQFDSNLDTILRSQFGQQMETNKGTTHDDVHQSANDEGDGMDDVFKMGDFDMFNLDLF